MKYFPALIYSGSNRANTPVTVTKGKGAGSKHHCMHLEEKSWNTKLSTDATECILKTAKITKVRKRGHLIRRLYT